MKIVSLSKVVPYGGIPHAGGEYYRRHVATLRSLGHDVVVVAPRDGRNMRAISRVGDGLEVHLVGPDKRTMIARLTDQIEAFVEPTRMPRRFRRALAIDRDALHSLASADVVEVHWTEMLSLIRDEWSLAAPILLIAYDVLSQRERSKLELTGRRRFLKWMHLRYRLWKTERLEPRILSQVDSIVVFSEKDAETVRSMTAVPDLHVVYPPLWDPRASENVAAPIKQDGSHPSVIMVGAFNRPENRVGARWFLSSVWPSVVSSFPSATLSLVGSSPGSSLRRIAAQSQNVVVTGYVDSIEPFYDLADVAVVPVLSGAGVKFKSLDALLRGIPLVSTSVGAEGIVDPFGAHPFAVRDGAREFADAVCRILADPHGAANQMLVQTQWAREVYGQAAFKDALGSIVGGLALRRA